MKNKEVNLMAIIAALAVIIGAFLPFAGITLNIRILEYAGDLSAMNNRNGWIFLLMAAIGLMSGLYDNRILEIFTGTAVTVLTLYGGFEAKSHSVLEFWGLSFGTVVIRIGYYVLLGGGIALLISGLISKNNE
ncbi:MAG: hypothetical protein IKP86_03860 [Anaerolineaceae bacterium]|nr:hypothetical protein [Anaerolineaceae bacterium]